MDVSTSSAATTLTRPRLAIQITAGVAAAFIAYSAWQISRQPPSSSPPPGGGSGGNLHRSNAVRRTERSTRRQIDGALEDIERYYGPGQRRELESILEHHFNARPHENAPHATPTPASSDPDASAAPPQPDENTNTADPRPPPAAAETVAEEQTMDDEWQDDPWSLPPQRAGHNIVGLLFRVSEDNARRNAYVHRGCMCNACGAVPIRGIRYRCSNCADFDLCEICESQGLHIKTHVFYKVKVPAPPFGPKSLQPVWYPGDPDTALRNLPGSLIKHLARETGFERPELEALWEQWTFIANTEWRDDPDELYLAADRKTFERYLVPSSGSKRSAPNLMHDRMFAFYDSNGDGLISFPEFLKGLSYKKGKERLERIFKGYDIDGDGYISRRDCLRIFRTYYVLYKQMHGDVLEALDQQAMHNTDTYQLVTGRQPLSSYFGREGRVPEADHGRPLEGKIFHSNGDIYVNDDQNGVVNETRPDVGNREEIIGSLFNHGDGDYGSRFYASASEHITSPTGDEVSHIYHEALLDPPTRVQELVQLLTGQARRAIQPSDFDPPNIEEPQNDNESAESYEYTSVEEEETDAARSAAVPEGSSTIRRPEPTTAVDGTSNRLDSTQATNTTLVGAALRTLDSERWTNTPPTDSQLRAQHLRLEAHRKLIMDKKLQITVRKKLFERWKKRSFYLMEEEGTCPPEGFDQDDDVLAGYTGTDAADSKEGQPPLSARSRSSSKVRFAEDTDDYEIRSNPSTSSRSVPERWGGMDIPDAERDMGKEILYVVTQQAFNEILDILFKEKEDLAFKAADSKPHRETFRELLDSFEPNQGGQSQQTEQPNGAEARTAIITEVDENKPVRDRSLPELLATSGYTVDNRLLPTADENAGYDADETSEEDQESSEEEFSDSPEEAAATTTQDIPFYDPTMPQFRPNSNADQTAATSSAASTSAGFEAINKETRASKLEGAENKSTPPRKTQLLMPPSPALLAEWKEHDVAERQAKERGGWGRLNLAEFKYIWYREEGGAQRLDYLGTWIDFCIP